MVYDGAAKESALTLAVIICSVGLAFSLLNWNIAGVAIYAVILLTLTLAAICVIDTNSDLADE